MGCLPAFSTGDSDFAGPSTVAIEDPAFRDDVSKKKSIQFGDIAMFDYPRLGLR